MNEIITHQPYKALLSDLLATAQTANTLKPSYPEKVAASWNFINDNRECLTDILKDMLASGMTEYDARGIIEDMIDVHFNIK